VTGAQRLGRAVGATNVVATMAAVVGLLLFPKVVGSLIAMLSWSDDAKAACESEPGCAVNLVPGGVLPVWWALAWIALIAISVLVCWSPNRWWSARGKGRAAVFADSTPRWLRVHAGVAAFVCVVLVFPGRSVAGAWAIEYLYAAIAAVAVMGLATLSLRSARAALDPKEFARLLGPGPFGATGSAPATQRSPGTPAANKAAKRAAAAAQLAAHRHPEAPKQGPATPKNGPVS